MRLISLIRAAAEPQKSDDVPLHRPGSTTNIVLLNVRRNCAMKRGSGAAKNMDAEDRQSSHEDSKFPRAEKLPQAALRLLDRNHRGVKDVEHPPFFSWALLSRLNSSRGSDFQIEGLIAGKACLLPLSDLLQPDCAFLCARLLCLPLAT